MSDETEVGIAPDAETILAPPVDYPETPAAWSNESVELLAEVERRTWSEAAMRAAGIAAGALITAVLIAAAGLAIIMAKPGQQLSVTVPQTPGVNPGAVTLPRSALPPDTYKTADAQAPGTESAAGPDYDARFIERLRSHGAVIVDRDEALKTGHWVCREIRSGTSIAVVTNELVSHLKFPPAEASNDITAAIAIYPNCAAGA